jgi:hypothetical protein
VSTAPITDLARDKIPRLEVFRAALPAERFRAAPFAVVLDFLVADFFAPLADLVEDFFAAFFELLEPLVVFEADFAADDRRVFLVAMFPLEPGRLEGGVVTKQRLPIAGEASLVVDH